MKDKGGAMPRLLAYISASYYASLNCKSCIFLLIVKILALCACKNEFYKNNTCKVEMLGV